MARRRKSFNRGAWAVQRERFRLEQAAPPADFAVESVADVLPGVVKKLGLAAPFWMESLRRDWPSIVGPDVAKRSRPGHLENKTLTIFVIHPTWLMELKRMERQVLEIIRQSCGREQVRAVRLALDPDAR
ncbi:MAG TPA: DUF721 domain-containing protein [Kiritimatiellia bacterium]|nr:DUF721 domain-containing protein [Kiritimatiellia bacterium]HRZ13495.1 DUF721 domain-containing protein [Kiritimatiellia bacterium]HSA19200.1 DUF721 domain-containing protein [Kiritimatiellia bacterium]